MDNGRRRMGWGEEERGLDNKSRELEKAGPQDESQ